MRCLSGFELYSRWVPLHLDLLQNIKEHQTPHLSPPTPPPPPDEAAQRLGRAILDFGVGKRV